MKNLKILLIVCGLCFKATLQAQDWNAIKINGVKWETIDHTWKKIKRDDIWRNYDHTAGDSNIKKLLEGNIKKLLKGNIKKLFGFDMKIGIEDTYSHFLYNDEKGLSIGFDDSCYDPSRKQVFYCLNDFTISNSNSNLTIEGATFTIGDSIDKLKNVKLTDKDTRETEISFGYGDGGALFIEFDPKTKKITRIYYTTWT